MPGERLGGFGVHAGLHHVGDECVPEGVEVGVEAVGVDVGDSGGFQVGFHHLARVPVRSLFDYLEGGDTLEEFLRQFPSVQREQTIAVLEAACEKVMADANSA